MAWTPEYPAGSAEPTNHTVPQVDDKYGVAFGEYLRANLAKVIDILGFWHSLGNSPTGQQGFSKQFRAGNGTQGVTPAEDYGVHEIFSSINVPRATALTAVLLDNSVDWRKRWINVSGLGAYKGGSNAANHFAGETFDGAYYSTMTSGTPSGTPAAVTSADGGGTTMALVAGQFYSGVGVVSNAMPTVQALQLDIALAVDEMW